jgi:UDP-N-acetylmuramate: L-alanyl-gamma-D-glutamyl-meso-diaminopimelate ligase
LRFEYFFLSSFLSIVKATGKHIHLTGVEDPLLLDLALALHSSGALVTCSSSSFDEAASSSGRGISGLKPLTPFSEKNVGPKVEWLVRGSGVPESNPEISASRRRGTEVVSLPQFISWAAEDQQRIVIAGNNDRRGIIDFIFNVLESAGRSFDYCLHEPYKGTRVRLSDAPVILIEGTDDPARGGSQPPFLAFRHHIGVISGISGGAIGAPEDEYVRGFDLFADATPKAGSIIYNESDSMANIVCAKERSDVQAIPFKPHAAEEQGGQLYLVNNGTRHPAGGVTRNDLTSLSAAREILRKIGVTSEQFYSAFS